MYIIYQKALYSKNTIILLPNIIYMVKIFGKNFGTPATTNDPDAIYYDENKYRYNKPPEKLTKAGKIGLIIFGVIVGICLLIFIGFILYQRKYPQKEINFQVPQSIKDMTNMLNTSTVAANIMSRGL